MAQVNLQRAVLCLGAAPRAWAALIEGEAQAGVLECLWDLNSEALQVFSYFWRLFCNICLFIETPLFSLFIEAFLLLSPILEERDILSLGGLKKRLSCFPLGRFILVG